MYFTFRCCTHICTPAYTLSQRTVLLFHFVSLPLTTSRSLFIFTFHRNPFFTFAQLGGGAHGMRKSSTPLERNSLFFFCISLVCLCVCQPSRFSLVFRGMAEISPLRAISAPIGIFTPCGKQKAPCRLSVLCENFLLIH